MAAGEEAVDEEEARLERFTPAARQPAARLHLRFLQELVVKQRSSGWLQVTSSHQLHVLQRLHLPPFGPAVLEPDLYAALGETQVRGQLLPAVDVWVVTLLEDLLQLRHLVRRESHPCLPLLPGFACTAAAGFWRL